MLMLYDLIPDMPNLGLTVEEMAAVLYVEDVQWSEQVVKIN